MLQATLSGGLRTEKYDKTTDWLHLLKDAMQVQLNKSQFSSGSAQSFISCTTLEFCNLSGHKHSLSAITHLVGTNSTVVSPNFTTVYRFLGWSGEQNDYIHHIVEALDFILFVHYMDSGARTK